MSEQLSMFSNTEVADISSTDNSLPPELNATEHTEYEALDKQLASLMLELNDYKPADDDERKLVNKTLKQCTLEISKRTREGQIALEITAEQQSHLLKTTVAGVTGDYMPLIIDADARGIYLYLNRYWQYQQRLANQISARIDAQESLNEQQTLWAHTRLADYFPTTNSDETNWQKRAVELALQHKFLIVSGGPGTGKTTTITRLLTLLIEQKLENNINDLKVTKESKQLKSGGVSFKILLAAPTGKAAIRMLDSMREASNALQIELNLDDAVLNHLPTEANTIHKLLGYKHNSTQFKHNKNNPLNADVVLVDEASMVDIALMSKLVDAIPEHAKLILIGDKDQLASVETGSVFADMCEGLRDSNHLVTLKKNWRFAADSDIGQAAIAANQGDKNSLLSVLNDQNRLGAELISPKNVRDADLIKPWTHYFAVLNNPKSSLEEIFTAFNQYRILCALRRGYNGSEIMNERIEMALEKQGSIQRSRSSNTQSQYSNWYHGRPIMITQNSYNKGLMNGDTGITLIKDGELKVFFPSTSGEFLGFSPVRLPAHETAWSMTIHKSQGSEFDQVVLILPQEEMPLLTRQLVYTGITRAKKTVSIVASTEVLEAGIKTEVASATMIANYLKTK